MKKGLFGILGLISLSIGLVTGLGGLSMHTVAASSADATVSPTQWQTSVQKAMDAFEDKGGYYTGRKVPEGFTQNAWIGMDKAVTIGADGSTTVDVSKARPSFCSSAIYMLFLKSLSNWSNDYGHSISAQSWRNLKPYTTENSTFPIQGDGVGAWGMANSNGPGFAVLINQLNMGKNYYVGLAKEYSSASARMAAFKQGKRYDVMKILWNDEVGKDEAGHLVLYLGAEDEQDPSTGKIEHYIYYWSSNGSKTDINAGYSIGKCNINKIKRAIFTRITNVENISNVNGLQPTAKNQFLADLSDKIDATTAQIKSYCGIQDTASVSIQDVDIDGNVLATRVPEYPLGSSLFDTYVAKPVVPVNYHLIGLDNGCVKNQKSLPESGIMLNEGNNGAVIYVYGHNFETTVHTIQEQVRFLNEKGKPIYKEYRANPITFARVEDKVTGTTKTFYKNGLSERPTLNDRGLPQGDGWMESGSSYFPALKLPNVKGYSIKSSGFADEDVSARRVDFDSEDITVNIIYTKNPDASLTAAQGNNKGQSSFAKASHSLTRKSAKSLPSTGDDISFTAVVVGLVAMLAIIGTAVGKRIIRKSK